MGILGASVVFFFTVSFGCILFLIYPYLRRLRMRPPEDKSPKYQVTVYGGGNEILKFSAYRYSVGGGQLYAHIEFGKNSRYVVVAGDYVLEPLSPTPPTVRGRYRATLFNQGVAVRAVDVVGYTTGICQVELITPSYENWILGGNYVLAPIMVEDSTLDIGAAAQDTLSTSCG